MALEFENSIEGITQLDFWYKVNNNQPLTLTDVPEILSNRWAYFRDNWEFLKEEYEKQISKYDDPETLRGHVESFSLFVESQRTSKSNRNPFDNEDIIYRFYSIFDNTLIDSISLTYEEKQIVDNKVADALSYTRGDFLAIRQLLQEERDAISDKVGLTDEDYNRVFNRSPQPARVDAKNRDVNKMYEIQEMIKSIDFILANSFSLESSSVDPFALARANADNPEIEIGNYFSGTLEKIDYGESLQSFAARTLGDPDRWIDIAIANGLKAPYIDEDGERIDLISNASGNQVNIAGTDATNNLNIDKLFIGQLVLLKSDVQTFPEQRKILNIREVPVSGEIIIQLDGEPDLDRYKIAEDAHIRIYKPNTINSSFYVLVPSTVQLEDEGQGQEPWFLQSSDEVEKRQKVDLSINEEGDLQFGPTGDLQLIFGLDNSVQAVRLKMSVEENELRRHPGYGLAVVQGQRNNNIEQVKETLVTSITNSIAVDERFAGLSTLDVVYSSPESGSAAAGYYISMNVTLAGTGQNIPISFKVNI
jgi:hypothetical protein